MPDGAPLRVGFVGLGTMGRGMAGNILRAGFDLTVYNRTRTKAEPLIARGARFAETLDALGDCDVVFTMVSDDAALRSVCFDGQLVAAMKPGAIHVASSTISTALAAELNEAHTARRQTLVGAPVSGRGDFAEAGTLFVIAAGAEEALRTCAPLFAAIGQRTLDFGRDATAAFVCKLAVNAMVANAIAAISEAYQLVEAWGVDRVQFNDFVTHGLFAAPAYKAYGGLIATHSYTPANFPVALGLKDLRLAVAAAEEKNVQLPAAAAVRNLLVSALAQGLGELDWSCVARAAYPASHSGKT
jgi:3-hydroxyisobutyrate dehydrogenase-like beta-hydroxyacid dehydrogenase